MPCILGQHEALSQPTPHRIRGTDGELHGDLVLFARSPAASQPYLRYSIVYIARSTIFTAWPSRNVRHTSRLV